MLGCESFALLFDDIECEMNETDRQYFSSFVAAQVIKLNFFIGFSFLKSISIVSLGQLQEKHFFEHVGAN